MLCGATGAAHWLSTTPKAVSPRKPSPTVNKRSAPGMNAQRPSSRKSSKASYKQKRHLSGRPTAFTVLSPVRSR